MKIDVTQKLMSFDGEELEVREKDDETGKISKVTLIFKDIACNALMSNPKEDDKTSGADKLARFKLASKVHGCEGEFEFSMKDLDLIKDQVTKYYTTIVTGAMWLLMEEPESTAVTKKESDES